MKTKTYGLTAVHEGAPDKPNEDAFSIDEESGIVVVADGVTRSRRPDGGYPSIHATVAPEIIVFNVPVLLRALPSELNSLHRAFTCVNQFLGYVNNQLGYTPDVPNFFRHIDYLCAGAVVFWHPPHRHSRAALVGWIGDCRLFHLPTEGDTTLITRDQLLAWNGYYPRAFSEVGLSEDMRERVRSERLFWERKYIRNQKRAQTPTGGIIDGFGVFTGEPDAVDFIETAVVPVASGDRFIGVSDAFDACADDGGVGDLILILDSLREASPEKCAREALYQTRGAEKAKGVRSDDFTFVVVDVL